MNFFKLYPGDYLRDTSGLSLGEHGAYSLMLMLYYSTEEPLPTGPRLYRMLRAADDAERAAVDAVVAAYWLETPAGLVNKRAALEIDKAEGLRRVSREVGKKGGRPRSTAQSAAAKNPAETQTAAEKEPSGNPAGFADEPSGLKNQNPDKTLTRHQTPDTRHQTPDATAKTPDNVVVLPTSSSSLSVEKSKHSAAIASQSKTAVSDLVADGLDEELASEWLAHRKRRKSPLTPRAWSRLKAEAAKAGVHPSKAVEQALARGWIGFEADWLLDKANKQARDDERHETPYQRSMRERMEQICPSIAAKPPTARRALPLAEVIDVPDAAPTAPVARLLG